MGGTGVGMWLSLTFRDANSMIGWLRAIGFTEHSIVRSEQGPSMVQHAEMLWPHGGGVMFSSHRDDEDNQAWPDRPGTAAAYLVTDDPDGVFSAAVAAGATPLREPRDQDYGGRVATVADPEGNLWSFGSYRP